MSEIKGKTICFTGTFATQTFAKASEAAKKHGAIVSTTITRETDLLVIGPKDAGAKVKQAEAKNIEVWTEEKFNSVLGFGENDGASQKKPAPLKKKKAAESEDYPTPKKAKKSTTVEAESTPPKNPVLNKVAPTIPSKSTFVARRVIPIIFDPSHYSVHQDYDIKLMLWDSHGMEPDKFYKMQLLYGVDGMYYIATHWGCLGESGKSKLKGPYDETMGISDFSKIFRSKTHNVWGSHPFVPYTDRYQIVGTIERYGEGALGRLTESQIHKGQVVLKKARVLLELSRNPSSMVLGGLSNEFYSLIPTTSGFQCPPRLDNIQLVTEKEGLLEFWLRMGFEEVSHANRYGSPIEGVFDLPVPSTLKIAAETIADSNSISKIQKRGGTLAESQAGDPAKKMSKELYAAILLYTGNSIYSELNRCLRLEWKSVPKYWPYLRLYFEAMDHMSSQNTTLWRGISGDLYDEYEEGTIITWWAISTCTADKNVAENFVSRLGEVAATLLTLHVKSACDISALSFYPHGRESLLRPGTKLRVLKRKRIGNVAEIELEEVVE